MMRIRLVLVALLLLGGAAGQERASESSLSIGSVQMLDCEQYSTWPCFRALVKFGKSLPASAGGLLRGNTTIEFDNKLIKPFYFDSTEDRKPRTAMILMDISGSMNKPMSNGPSRFDTAKQAIDRFVSSLDPDLDRVAIVPFDNHDVRPTIDRARFVPGGEEARGLLAAIPGPRGDTALFAAIDRAIDQLETRQRREPDREYQLIVITDGEDDPKNTDPELRQRPVSLEAVALKAEDAKRHGISVYPIGIGTADDTSMLAPLERISIDNSAMVDEPGALMDILEKAQPAPAAQMRIAFLSPFPTRGELEGRSHIVRVRIGQPGRQVDAVTSWAPKESMTAPQAREECSRDEKQALSKFGGLPQEDYTDVGRPLATLAVFTCILLLCWFLMPRLIWPEDYAEDMPKVDGGARWSAGRQAPASKAAANAAREETDATYVLPGQERDPRSRFK